MKSIIIPTCTESHLLPLLESIEKYTDLSDVEIIVVANGYDGEMIDIPTIAKVIESDERLGYTVSINLGIKESKGDVIILLNDDVVLLPQNKNDWINLLCNPLKDNIGMTAPLKLYCPHAEHDFACFFCVAIRKDVIDKVGLLDESFNPGYGEDTDYSIRVEQAGFKVIQVPTPELKTETGFMVGNFPVYHKGEATFGVKPEWEEIKKRNQKILSDKYKLPEGWFYGGDVEEYRRLVEDVPENGTMIELGCYKGRSLASVSDIIKRKGLNVWVVDIFTGTKSEGNNEEDYRETFLTNVRRFGIEPIALQQSTDSASNVFPDKNFDLIFIDADHSYEAIKNDIENWLPKIKETGVISGHDYGSHPGISKAVNERFNNVRVASSVWSKRIGY